MLIRKLDFLSNSIIYEELGGFQEFKRILREVLKQALKTSFSIEHVEEFSCIGRRDVPQFNERRVAWTLPYLGVYPIGVEVALSKKDDAFHKYPLLDLLENKGYRFIDRTVWESLADDIWTRTRGVTKFDVIGRGSSFLWFIEVKSISEVGARRIDEVSEELLQGILKKEKSLYNQFIRQYEFVIKLNEEVSSKHLYAVVETATDRTTVHIYEVLDSTPTFKFFKEYTLKEEEFKIDKCKDFDDLLEKGRKGKIPLCQAMRSILYLTKIKMLQLGNRKLENYELVTLDRNEIAEWFEKEFGFPLTQDNRRHDMEDQLERRGFIGRLPGVRGVKYYITPAGLVRVTYFEALLFTSEVDLRKFLEEVKDNIKKLSKAIIKTILK